ncbi:alpha-L-rhamnosidase-related protein [Fontibacter flavus]|uniref:Alpha-L-rhamnosidase N-terminal domain-containing protein n=1 Tax=Fontibacter flavus TaxID=654838 RepID=A0ABV6FNT4_9BACT
MSYREFIHRPTLVILLGLVCFLGMGLKGKTTFSSLPNAGLLYPELQAQNIPSKVINSGQQENIAWKARWISLPENELPRYAVVQARNEFELVRVPQKLMIDLSAVIRYKLFINGVYIGQGPANNDLQHYAYDTYDIAPHLKTGKNVIALTVFSLGEMNPLRYHDLGLRFIVQTSAPDFEKTLNTGTGTWKIQVNQAYEATVRGKDFDIYGYFAMGGGEQIEGDKYPWDWHQTGFDDSAWSNPRILDPGRSYGHSHSYGHAEISLNKREIPMMNEEAEKRPKIRKTSGYWQEELLAAWNNQESLRIPKYTETVILLDQEYLTKGHTHFTFSGGEGAVVEVAYAEALFGPDRTQGNRNEIEGKALIGQTDRYILDGGSKRSYSQLLPRTWRFIELRIKTSNEDLIFDNYFAHKFFYPFEQAGSFSTPFQIHEDIWEVGWRTALLCADETYMDCPYYEQLQYVGDTRVQALISLYAAGDDRLMKNAIRQFAHSITDEGITQSRYPSSLPQMIPPYSLFWVNMLHDYYMHRDDPEFVEKYLPQISSVLHWFENKLQDDYILGPMPWWSYTDVTGWEMSSPPGFKDGGSVVMTLQYLYAIQEAIPLFQNFGKGYLAGHFRDLSTKIQNSIHEKAWVQERGMLADLANQSSFSQHANIFGILTNTVDKSLHGQLFQKIIEEEGLAQANIYFRFYLTRAAQYSGNGDYFINNLQTWERMLEEGLTTFAEHEFSTRSDCHAWSASPNFEFIHTVCGIQPKEKHFRSVLIAPNPGYLSTFEGSMPHPKGKILTKYDFEQNYAEITLPPGLEGTFEWQGKSYALKSGNNTVKW